MISRLGGIAIICVAAIAFNFNDARASAVIETEGLMKNAEIYYSRYEYDKALEIYLGWLETGIESGPIYFNIGNCYMQKGDSVGKAIYYYEMARRLMPRDTALLINLKYAKSLVKEGGAVPAEPFMLRILRKAFDRFTLGEAFTTSNVCYFGCAIFFVISLFVKRFKALFRITAILLLLILIGTIIPLRAKIMFETRTGIVTAPAAFILSEPFEDSPLKFPVNEGMRAQVLKATSKWYKIKCPDGKVGWIIRESLWRLRG